MAHSEQKHHEIDSSKGYEKRDVHIPWAIITTVVIVVLIIASFVFVDEIFVHTKEQIIQEVVLKPESIQLRDLRARETEVLSSYKVIDAQKGVYQIPIEQAMKLIVDESFQAKSASSN